MDYNKPPLTTAQHIEVLEQRGLCFADKARAERYIATIGYYRLSAYYLPFIDRSQKTNNHEFKPDSSFNQILSLYIFDRQLRLIVLEAIERLEVAIRTCWANDLSIATQDAHAYIRPKNFKNAHKHQKCLAKVQDELKSSNEKFIVHYFERYTDPTLPPIWAMAETLSFGALSHWYHNTRDNRLKMKVARVFGLPNVAVMESVLHALTLLRNTCAHHSRLWNRQFTKGMPLIHQLSSALHIETVHTPHGQSQQQPNKKIYNTLVVLSYMMLKIQPHTQWQSRLVSHLQHVEPDFLGAMGFPEQWQHNSFWRDRVTGLAADVDFEPNKMTLTLQPADFDNND